MIPTAAIIAMAVDSAPTRTEVRRSEPARLRVASSPSTPKKRLTSPALAAETPDTSAGSTSAEAAISKTAEAYPNRGFPDTGDCCDAIHARAASNAAPNRLRRVCIRTSCSRRPRAIASTGTT